MGQPFATQKSFRKQKRTTCIEESSVSYKIPEKRGLLLSPITNQASLKYASRGQQSFVAISCPVTRWHQEHIILVPKEAQIQLLL